MVEYRMVTPFFNLNRLLNVRATPLPTIEDIRGELAGSTLFSTFDLSQAFFQVPLEEESKPYTAFACTGSGLYQYSVLPMGCSASSAVLQSAMVEILGLLFFNGCIIYVDDIIVYTRMDMEHHLKFLEKVVDVLEKANAKLKLRKVEIEREEVRFLGMYVSREGWRVHEKFTNSVLKANADLSLILRRKLLR